MTGHRYFVAVLCFALFALTDALTLRAAEAQAAPEGVADEGREIVTNSIGMKLVRIDPGKFVMGSEEGDPDERPVREVTITRPLLMGVCEVTREQYAKVMGIDLSSEEDGDLPVDSVSWDDAKAFCKRLSAMEKAEYRLPTEAEWEYACRAGTKTVFYWGDSFDTSYFWCGYNAGSGPRRVGQAKPNPWGLYDMSGNVWEWCEDWYAEDAYAAADRRDPRGPATGSRRVLRGGSWYGTPEDCRSANRLGYDPDSRVYTIGFRICRVAP
jgi:formylglycine-generating enzyme required for sulfatase activity